MTVGNICNCRLQNNDIDKINEIIAILIMIDFKTEHVLISFRQNSGRRYKTEITFYYKTQRMRTREDGKGKQTKQQASSTIKNNVSESSFEFNVRLRVG